MKSGLQTTSALKAQFSHRKRAAQSRVFFLLVNCFFFQAITKHTSWGAKCHLNNDPEGVKHDCLVNLFNLYCHIDLN